MNKRETKLNPKMRKVLLLIVIMIITIGIFACNYCVEAEGYEPVVGIRTYRNPVNGEYGYSASGKIIWKLVEYLNVTNGGDRKAPSKYRNCQLG